MKQQSKQTHSSRRAILTVVVKLTFPLLKQIKGKTTQKEDESFIQTLQAVGMPEENIPKMQALIENARKIGKNRKENYKSDKIYVGGIAALVGLH